MLEPKAKILILDDETKTLRLLTDLLQAEGYQPYPIADSYQALLVIQNTPPDLVLLDILLPKMNGFEVYERIKAQAEAENIPIIFVSALEGAWNKVKAFNMGAVDYITKPFRFEELLARIQTHLNLRRVQKQLQDQYNQLAQEIEKRLQIEKSLQKSQHFLISVLDALTPHIAIIDATGVIIAVNEAWRNFAYSNGLLSHNYGIGCNYLTICYEATGECSHEALAVAEGIKNIVTKQQESFYLEYPCHSPTEQRWFAAKITRFEDDGLIYAVIAHENVTERKLAEEIRLKSEANLKAILHNNQNSFILIDLNYKVQAFNNAANELSQRLFKYPMQINESIYHYILPENQADFQTHYQAALQGENLVVDYKLHNIDKGHVPHWLSYHYNPAVTDDGQIIGVCLSMIDITESKHTEKVLKQANELLFQLATIDGLTQIANRRQFDTYLSRQWQQALRQTAPFSLILADIDYFKNYNDYYGHQIGDECLRQVAKTLQLTIDEELGLVSRYGGEEFAIILPNMTQNQALAQAHLIQMKIKALALPHAKSEVSNIITLSLGIASVIATPHYSTQQLIAQTDQALYEAKQGGRNQIIMRQLV